MPQRMVYVRDSNGQPIPIQVEVDTGTGILLCKLLANSGIDIGDVDVISLPGTSEADIGAINTALQTAGITQAQLAAILLAIDVSAKPQITPTNLCDAQSIGAGASVTIAAALDLTDYNDVELISNAAFAGGSDDDLTLYMYPIKPDKVAYSLASRVKQVLVNNAGGTTDAVMSVDVRNTTLVNIVATNASSTATTLTCGINKVI